MDSKKAIKNENTVKYEEMVNSVEYHRVMLENAQASARLVLAALQEQIGNTPFEVNGREVSILVRRGVIQTMPVKRPRKAKDGEAMPCEGIGLDSITIGA